MAAIEQALEGLRVLNLSSTLGGAFVGQFFADFGAEVALVEPAGGSPLRSQAGWPIWSRGSQSLQAALDDPAVHALARRADVLIDTFRPGVLERHGLGHEQLARDNPRLVTAAITAFGRTGPLARLKGYEGVAAAKAGLYSQFGAAVARPGPGFATVPYCTVSAAMLAFAGALAALYERESSGRGQRVDATLAQAIAAHDTWQWMIALMARRGGGRAAAGPAGQAPKSWVAYGLLQGLSKDGRWLQFSQATRKQFHTFLQVVGMDDPAWDGAWEDDDAERRDAFWSALLAAVRTRTLAEWRTTFDAHPDVFAEVFRRDAELLHHPQLVFDDHVATPAVAGLGEVRQPKPFVRLSKTPGSAMRPPPALDQHGAVLRRQAAEPAATLQAPGEAPAALPLAGVTIVELGSFYAGPFGVTLLADLGARVLKVEPPDGDPIRFQIATPELAGVKVTQGKESIAVDIRQPEGLAIVKRLLVDADLVLQSFRAGVAERLGLDEAAVRAINPDVVYHQSPGFGVGGPYGHRPAYAPTIGAGSGMTRRNAQGSVPERSDLTLEDVKAASARLNAASGGPVGHADGFSALGVACAQALGLLARARGAGGQGMVTTMLTTLAQVLSEDMIEYAGRPAAPTADPEMYGFSPLYRLYETQAGWVFLAAPGAGDWAALQTALPGAGLDDPRFATAAGRVQAAEALAGRLAAAFRARSAAEWEAALTAADIACVEAVERPAWEGLMAPGGLAERLGMTAEVDHPLFGRHIRLASVIGFSRSITRAEAGVMIGQHTAAVLREFGYGAAEIDDLAARGVIRLQP